MTRPLKRDALNIASAVSNNPRPLNDFRRRPRRMLRWFPNHSGCERRTGVRLAVRRAYVRRNQSVYASRISKAQRLSAAAFIEAAGEILGGRNALAGERHAAWR